MFENEHRKMKRTDFTYHFLRYIDTCAIVQIGNWSAKSYNRTFKVNNNGIKLWAKRDEELEQIIFDVNKKTVEVKVKNPTLPKNAPRKLDLSNDVRFFEELRKSIEFLLIIQGGFEDVTSNDDRTIFTIQ